MFLLVAALAAQVPVLPDGPGKETVKKLCSNCHGVAILFAPRRTKTAWQKSVEQMEALGVEGSEQEFETVVEYLTRYFGKINVNRASAAELRQVLDIGEKEAEAIVRHRGQNGEFKDLENFRKAAGLEAAKMVELRDRILFR
jgi:competence ComEA-like helix-hairpin-helix protein